MKISSKLSMALLFSSIVPLQAQQLAGDLEAAVLAEIEERHRQEQKAFVEGDCETVVSFYSDEATIYANGRRIDSLQAFREFCSRIPRPFRGKGGPPEINEAFHVLSDNVVYFVRTIDFPPQDDEATPFKREVVTKVWSKSDGGWKIVHFHSSVKEVDDPSAPTSAPAGDEAPTIPPGMGVFLAVEGIAPVVPVSAEGARHLFYELRLTSFDPRDFRLERLEVLDEHSRPTVLASYDAEALKEKIESPGRAEADLLRIAPGTHSVLFLRLVLDPSEPLPSRLRHRFTLSGEIGGKRATRQLEADALPVSPQDPAVIAPPLRGGPWYAHAGPAKASHHRRILSPRDGTLTMDQRFASDWFRLEEAAGESDTVSYPGPDWTETFGAEVRAVADGRVVVAVEGFPDDPISARRSPGEVISWQTIGGNRIALDLGGGRFAWYAHLQAGSLRVQEGERVRRGQVLGRIGNSGNSAAPHLHFQITDSDVIGKGRGLPFVFECFDLVTRVDPMPDWEGLNVESPKPVWKPPLTPGSAPNRREREIPLGGAVVFFPQAAAANGEAGCEGAPASE